jgi:hypothetical protein
MPDPVTIFRAFVLVGEFSADDGCVKDGAQPQLAQPNTETGNHQSAVPT